MAKRQSTITSVVKGTPKPKLSPEITKAIAEAQKDILLFSGTMDGLLAFCANVTGTEEWMTLHLSLPISLT